LRLIPDLAHFPDLASANSRIWQSGFPNLINNKRLPKPAAFCLGATIAPCGECVPPELDVQWALSHFFNTSKSKLTTKKIDRILTLR
jgi:hypothetical protein